jgi:hypothetical protein
MRAIGGGAINKAKTHCSKGHPYSKENTARDRNNKRYCRTCRKAYQASYNKGRPVEF